MNGKIKISGMFFAAAAVGASAVTAKIISVINDAKQGVRNLTKNFTITAHTGANGTKMNSFASLAASLRSKADIAETDLNFSSDGEPVLSHNTPTDECVSLYDAFAFAEKYGDKKINVDVKTTALLEKLPTVAEQTGMTDNIFFTGIEQKDISAVKEKAPSIPYWLNCKPDKKRLNDTLYLYALADTVKKCGAIGVNIKYVYASKTLVRAMHENGLLVSVWTANTLTQMLNVLALSPDNITTKKPDFLASLIDALLK